ncbi:MAG: DUF29 domain-containing protein [Alphaproteobacteria bacterium]|nr:DUF29 domain-containing protein [Alphaproteobacteria bacterium]
MDQVTAYESDYYAWTQAQAEALRAARAAGTNLPLDWENLIEEVADLGGSLRREVESSLARVIEHLLKLEHARQEEPRRGWKLSVAEHRDRIEASLRDSPSLRRLLPDLLPPAWRRGRKLAATALALYDEDATLPHSCPYALDDLCRDDWYPESRQGLPRA